MEKTIMQNKDYDQNFDYAKKQLIQQGESRLRNLFFLSLSLSLSLSYLPLISSLLFSLSKKAEICNRECQAAHYGRNCLQCRKPYVLHFAHNCPALSHLNRSVSGKEKKEKEKLKLKKNEEKERRGELKRIFELTNSKAKQRGNFSLAHQDECGPDCKGYHINKGCNLCSQLFGDHFNGHWCDQKETIRGDFGPFVGVKPAKR